MNFVGRWWCYYSIFWCYH